MQRTIGLLWFSFLLLLVSSFTTPTNGQSTEAEQQTTIRLQENEEVSSVQSSFSVIKCQANADCNHVGRSDSLTNPVPLICDDLEKICKCPLTSNGTKVVDRNGTCQLMEMQQQSSAYDLLCKEDKECKDWMYGAVCLIQDGGQSGKCGCRGGMSLMPAGGHPSMSADGDASMPADEHASMSTEGHMSISADGHPSMFCVDPNAPTPWNEWVTLKWLFVFMLIGYPVLTLLFAIFHQEKDDHWFFEKFAALLHWSKQNKMENQKQRRQKLRRNTHEDLVSTDDDDSPLEMEIV